MKTSKPRTAGLRLDGRTVGVPASRREKTQSSATKALKARGDQFIVEFQP